MTAATGLPPCPRCGSTDAVEIVYGYPTAEAFEASERGEVVLGGCVIGPEAPDYECRACHSPLPWALPDKDEWCEVSPERSRQAGRIGVQHQHDAGGADPSDTLPAATSPRTM